jgi:hypothetical protein
MGTSQSRTTVCCPVRLDDFVYETPGHNRTRVTMRLRRKARQARVWSPEGSPSGAGIGKSRACRQLAFPDGAKRRRAASGVPHQWMPRAGVLNRMWCGKKRKCRPRNAFRVRCWPMMFLR